MMTASDIPSLLGECFFKTTYDVIQQKVDRICKSKHLNLQNEFKYPDDHTPPAPKQKEQSTAAMEWGTYHESEALAEFVKRTGHKVVNAGLLRHPQYAFLGGSPDGITYCGAILEIKCPYSAKIPNNPRVMPAHYRSQVQCLLEITGFDKAYFVQYRPEGYGPGGVVCADEPCRFNCLVVPRDLKWAESSIPIIERAYNDFLRQVAIIEKCTYFDENDKQ
jgi:putative phage-type endonuclease